MPFTVLMVCTGNVCRSPLAERLLAARVGSPVTVASAGVRALVGRGIDGPSATALRELGGDPDGHAARLLTREMVDAADLVLTAATGHRTTVLQAAPTALRRIFTMREFARLGAAMPPLDGPVTAEALRERVAQVAAQRGFVEPAPPGEDDIGDPFGAPLEVARRTAGEVADTVSGVVAALGLRVSAR